MNPAPGGRVQRFVGDRVLFTLAEATGEAARGGWRARLRTNLGRADILCKEIIQAHTRNLPAAGASWHDLPMRFEGGEWRVELPLVEPGYFQAKAYLLDPAGWQHWPDGSDVRLSVHPDSYRTANTIYCAFTRMFGESREKSSTANEKQEAQFKELDAKGFTVIPPSGKFRDLIRQLPHILDTLGCRILHLLPVNPTPTTMARFGRFGSPYASLDMTAIDPALVEFDKRTTGVDQFCERTYATHLKGGRVFLDMIINHTGWGSALQENHPEWFLRGPDGAFVSPGAWGTVWEDLVELEHRHVELWDGLAGDFLVWCRRGVDGFRCDAGYKVPLAAWQYITARVRQEFPETIFLLEGLGGAWEVTEQLLIEGGMQWAYSELFQNYSGPEIAAYLDYVIKLAGTTGLLAHYSETHDNPRLAERGRAWSLLRNRLCAFTSISGGYGFTCGVEWLAPERVNVHSSRGLAWGNPDNLIPDLARLNRLLAAHPCFFDGAKLTRLSPPDSPVYALRRDSWNGQDRVLVLVNTDTEKPQKISFAAAVARDWSDLSVELTGQTLPARTAARDGALEFTLSPGAACCLATSATPIGLAGTDYRVARAQAAWALTALHRVLPIAEIPALDWQDLALIVSRSPSRFLAACSSTDPAQVRKNLERLRDATAADEIYPPVVTWELADRRRVLPVPPGHWLLIRDSVQFRATLSSESGERPQHVQSIFAGGGQIACFPPGQPPGDAHLTLERYGLDGRAVDAEIRFLSAGPDLDSGGATPLAISNLASWRDLAATSGAVKSAARSALEREQPLVLLTNGLGGMARLCVDLGAIKSKYDCLLAANLHPRLPVDRHVFAKRARVWVNADGFISPLDLRNLASFKPGPPAVWQFVANAGNGRTVEIVLRADMLPGRNTTVLRFERPAVNLATEKPLPDHCEVRLTLRVDIEDRNFHSETHRNGDADFHFSSNSHPLTGRAGFAFTPAADRHLRVYGDTGVYHPAAEWCENIAHPIEQSRGQTASGDAFSPGWFEIPRPRGARLTLVVTAEDTDPAADEIQRAFAPSSPSPLPLLVRRSPGEGGREGRGPGRGEGSSSSSSPSPGGSGESSVFPPDDAFGQQLLRAARAFVVRRDDGITVIAGYPWFLDWGRDSLICARGLLAAGMTDQVRQLLLTFARFEKDGTLPNTIHGEDASNRDTSDAPLWFGIACEDFSSSSSSSSSSSIPPTGKGEVKVPGELSPQSPLPLPSEGRGLGVRSGPLGRGEGRGEVRVADDTFYQTPTGNGRTLAEVLTSIAANYERGTPNGIRMDPASALIWSPSHFTWMDTNYPAGTPREGYPVEIQVLWIRLLRQLARIGAESARPRWQELAARAEASFNQYYWLAGPGYFADLLLAQPGQPAASAVPDNALRSNCLLAVSLGLVTGEPARRCVDAALRYLVVPGALRTLAPLPVNPPLPVFGNQGQLLNNPAEPYWGRYEGDEDTRRKPAYHNGTAWTWTFPIFCEALARAWDNAPGAVAAARAYLGSMDRLLMGGCLGQIPEILDGDAPHTQRGCDAQAWGVTEALRVWKLLRPQP